jgi:hypothetical protein
MGAGHQAGQTGHLAGQTGHSGLPEAGQAGHTPIGVPFVPFGTPYFKGFLVSRLLGRRDGCPVSSGAKQATEENY